MPVSIITEKPDYSKDGQFNKICRNAKRLGYYTPVYEWCEWNINDKPIRYLTDNEEQRILKELDPSSVKDPYHKKSRQAARDIFILMVDGGFRINEASIMQWSDIDFDNGVIYHPAPPGPGTDSRTSI